MFKRKILIVDDCEEDRFFLQRGLAKEVPTHVVVGTAADGALAVEYLSGTGKFANRELFPFPDVIFLDLKMPRMNGFEVLAWLQQQQFRNLEVIVLSNSSLEIDLKKAKAFGPSHYVVKGHPAITAKAITRILNGTGREPF